MNHLKKHFLLWTYSFLFRLKKKRRDWNYSGKWQLAKERKKMKEKNHIVHIKNLKNPKKIVKKKNNPKNVDKTILETYD